jgi:hypothetical protein
MKIEPIKKTGGNTPYNNIESTFTSKPVHGLIIESGSIVPATIVTISDSYYNTLANVSKNQTNQDV